MRFALLFDPGFGALSRLLLLSPRDSYVEVEGDLVRIRMAWGFRAVFPRKAVRTATLLHRKPLSRGVHGWRGRWLVNGSGRNIVSVELEPPQRARVLGWVVRLRELRVSVEDPTGLLDALQR